jgi:hypothetical protein
MHIRLPKIVENYRINMSDFKENGTGYVNLNRSMNSHENRSLGQNAVSLVTCW